MIPALMPNRFGLWLKATREETIDPTTGRPYTQARLAELLNVSTSKVASWEREAVTSISPDDAHLLSRILHRSETEILQAVGYDVDVTALKADEQELLAAYRRLRDVPILQETALRVIRAMPATNGPLLDRTPRRRRQSA